MNYKKLIEDFNNGTIDKSRVKLIMDNDDCFLSAYDENLSDDEIDKIEKKLTKKYGRGNGKADIYDILDVVGIPHMTT